MKVFPPSSSASGFVQNKAALKLEDIRRLLPLQHLLVVSNISEDATVATESQQVRNNE